MAQRPSPESSQRPRPEAGSPARPPETSPTRVLSARNTRLVSWLELVAAILLLYFTVQGFASGETFFPFGFGLMALYFFYGYIRNSLKVNFGSLTVPLNLVLLLGALVCLVLGIQNEAK